MRWITLAVFAVLAAHPRPAAPGSAESRFAVTATLRSVARVEVVSALGSVVLSRAQAQARRLVVPDALSVAVMSMPGGYGIDFEILDPMVARVEVEGLGRKVVVGPEGRQEWFPAARGRASIRLAYVVAYREGISPGPRPAPLSVRFDLS